MKKMYFLLLTFLLIFVFPSFAHPGRTDSNGGHYDRSTGEYHYHHGFSAHQHTGGVCPYNFVNETGQPDIDDSQTNSLDTNDYKSGLKEGKRLTQDELETYKNNVLYISLFFGIPIIILLLFLSSKIKGLKYKSQKDIEKITEIALYRDKLEISLAELRTQFSNSLKNINYLEEKIKMLNDYNNLLYNKLFSTDIMEMAGVPADVIFDSDILPHCYTDDGIDIFIVYISKSGNKYHEKNGCSNSYVSIHVIKARECGYIPCSKCVTNNDYLEWYTKYLSLINIKNRQTK